MSAITTARLTLLPWRADDVTLLSRLSSASEVMRFIGPGELWSARRSAEVSDAAVRHWAEHGFGWRVAHETESGRPVGFIGLNFAGEGTAGLASDEYEIGWWMEPSAWGRGYAREGGLAVREAAFGALAAPSLVARIQPANVRSIAVARGLGLTHDFDTAGRSGEPVSVYRVVRGPTLR